MTQAYWNKKFEKKDHYGPVHTPFAEECSAFLKQQNFQGKKLLDLGCGQGQDALFWANNGYEVTALDYSEQALDSITDNRIKKVKEDMRNIKHLGDDSFDLIYSSFSLHFFKSEELNKIFSEIYRILKSGGLLMFIAKNKKDKYYGKGERIDDETFVYHDILRYFFTEPILKKLLQRYKIMQFKENSIFHKSELPIFYWGIIAKK